MIFDSRLRVGFSKEGQGGKLQYLPTVEEMSWLL